MARPGEHDATSGAVVCVPRPEAVGVVDAILKAALPYATKALSRSSQPCVWWALTHS
jgi:hypothetical protein